MDIAIVIIAAVVAGGIGFAIGTSSGRSSGREAALAEGRAGGLKEGRAEGDARIRALVAAVERGREPDGAEPGSAEADLHAALRQGWAPRSVEREAALREAIGRVSTFLENQVRAPLDGVSDGASAAELRERIDRAVGAIGDLNFFVGEMSEVREGTNLSSLAQQVSREFAADQAVGVRLLLGSNTVRAVVNPTALMDALYLVLHNAGRFGGGTTVDLTVEEADRRARIVVRDRGAGFSEEAFARAFDPFYSTSDEGLGLGLPHVRKVVEEMGGEVSISNVPDGGAEVELSFPLT